MNTLTRTNRAIFSSFIISAILGLAGCNLTPTKKQNDPTINQTFEVVADRFADTRVLRYQVPGFDELDIKNKELVYYLYQAALSGRDIMWDQNNKYNLRIRQLIENIVRYYDGDRNTPEFNALIIYAKQMWFANGIHHHYSNKKFVPGFSMADLRAWLATLQSPAVIWPLQTNQSLEDLLSELEPVIFDPNIAAKKVNKEDGVDKVAQSAVNFYENVTDAEVEAFYKKARKNDDATPISHGLNSKLIKQDGVIVERVWKVDGMYSDAIKQMVYWLQKASAVAENPQQKSSLDYLVKYYSSGNLADFDDYNIAWVKDTDSTVDVINGFIEVYNDPIGYRGSFESVVSIRDVEATKRIAAIANEAQWFEDNSPLMTEHKKANVVGISGKAITVVVESGDSSPTTPVGINLPNSDWIRSNHGSKSVSLSNIVEAYEAAKGETLEEFAYSKDEIQLSKQYGEIASQLHVDMHEVIGHASGTLNPGVGSPAETMKEYYSTMEEARADLVGLYYVYDQKLVDIGVAPNIEVGRVAYDSFIRNGLIMQLYRLQLGEKLEEAHMQNRQIIAKWVYENGKKDNVIEFKIKEGKTYTVINDYQKLRELFGQLLREIQRIKSEGDYQAAKALVENYGVNVDQKLHAEVLARFQKLNIAPYSGFINPRLVPIYKDAKIVNVRVEYPDNFQQQMLEYSEKYSFLPYVN